MMEMEVIHLDESSPGRSNESPQGGGAKAITRDSEAGSSAGHGESSRYEKEPAEEELEPSLGLKYPFLQRVNELDDEEWGIVLDSCVAQSKAVEQFYLPRDNEYLRRVPNTVLHLSLQSYLVRGALME
ncbi:uncharacterized protein A4U43_C02F14410 [Asparagus officinalis]|uniref:Uncharacterized protein n=1 Tax=Asparagus officinalis TaxID=4686 RepID=A0A5P1FI84_ASPOF|nr:uncharacterized protein A4U43_C02F14410 [Asparagus officinalis]